jgi:hypothetical protein
MGWTSFLPLSFAYCLVRSLFWALMGWTGTVEGDKAPEEHQSVLSRSMAIGHTCGARRACHSREAPHRRPGRAATRSRLLGFRHFSPAKRLQAPKMQMLEFQLPRWAAKRLLVRRDPD